MRQSTVIEINQPRKSEYQFICFVSVVLTVLLMVLLQAKSSVGQEELEWEAWQVIALHSYCLQILEISPQYLQGMSCCPPLLSAVMPFGPFAFSIQSNLLHKMNVQLHLQLPPQVVECKTSKHISPVVCKT